MDKLFCIECGKEEKLYNNLCESCFRKKTKLASTPTKIKILKCPHCSAINYQKKWHYSNLEIENILTDFINFNEEATEKKINLLENFDKKHIKFKVFGKIKELELSEELSTELIIKSNSCDICSKKFGDYHEAIIQFRTKGRSLYNNETEKAREIIYDNISNMQEKDRKTFITKESKVKGGIDFYISSTNTASTLVNLLLNEFGGTHSKSPKLVGRKDGKEIYRITFLVRIPNYRLGDFIVLEKQIYRIKRIGQKNVIVKDMKGNKLTFNINKIENAKILGNEEILKEAMIISQSKKEVQILEPDTYKTIDVIKPIQMEFKVGETVKIIKYEENVFIYCK